ncbi:MAG: sulfatase-like hydrolase/transferase [Planctomycetota bacterium]
MRCSAAAAVGRAVGLLVTLASAMVAGAQGEAPDARGPNVVVILSDDAGYGDFGFTGGQVVATPNIDRIASEGAVLRQFYTTASVCSPSRAGFITGRYQQRFGHHSNLTGPASRQGLGMATSEQTVADHLSARGYATGIIGKWHLGSAEGLTPTERGFDEFHGLIAGSRSFFAIDGEGTRQGLQQTVAGDDGVPVVTWVDERAIDGLYVTDWTGEQAVSFIDRHADRAEPFYLFVSFTAPHTPMDALSEDLEAVGDIEPERRRIYAAMQRSLDRNVGAILDALDEAGAADNTMVAFFNDNGGATNNGSDNGRFRGMKGSKWEGGVRVPCAIRWPGVVPAGVSFTPVTSAMDLTATAVAAAGGPVEGSLPLDGRDLAPVIASGGPWAATAVHDVLFWERGPAGAVRSGDWKVIFTDQTEPMLFHVPGDPSETTDLAGERPEVVERLMAAFDSWHEETVEPLWLEGEKWENFQRRKHRTDVVGREAERELP